MIASVVTVAWRPFLDPLHLHQHWWALLPLLALGIAIIYKAIRLPETNLRERYWREVIIMTLQIVIAMIALGFATYLLVEVYRPMVR